MKNQKYVEIPEEEEKEQKRVKHAKDNALEKHEQDKLKNAIYDLKIQDDTKLRYRVLVALTMEAGLRVSEAIQCRKSWLQKTDDGVTIKVPEKDRDIKNKKRDWKPKTLQGEREVIFNDKDTGSMVYTFFMSNPDGLKFSRQRAAQVISLLGVKIGKPNLHPHALRSTYANNLVYAGVTPATLQNCLGWANLATAQDYIRTSNIAERKEVLEKMRGEK